MVTFVVGAVVSFQKVTIPNDVSLFEQIRLAKVHQEAQFAAHVCLEYPPETR